MDKISTLTIALVVLVGAAVGFWCLLKFLSSQTDARGIGIFSMVLGAIGIVVPLLVLMGNSSPNVQLAVLISGAILFGSGTIAMAIGMRKE